ncbi:hypothetical protein ACPV5V_20720, partial [Vibrio campbellii]
MSYKKKLAICSSPILLAGLLGLVPDSNSPQVVAINIDTQPLSVQPQPEPVEEPDFPSYEYVIQKGDN